MNLGKKMIIIDVGNSTIAFYQRDNNQSCHLLSVISSESNIDKLQSIIKKKQLIADKIIISSVVIHVLQNLKIIYNQYSIDVFHITHQHLLFDHKYENINQLGIDRGCNIVYGLSQNLDDFIIVDLGSAITMEVVKNKCFLGGIITPGFKLALNNLYQKTHLLPKIDFKIPNNLIGNSTISCIQSGVINGFILMCNSLLEEIIKDIFHNKTPQIILTGGFAKSIASKVNFPHYIETKSIIYGAIKIAQKNHFIFK